MPEPVTSGNTELLPMARWKIIVVVLFAIAIALIDLTITQDSGDVWSYLLPIVPILLFTIGLGLKKRAYGYTFALFYGVTCGGWMLAGSIRMLSGIQIEEEWGKEALFVGGAGLAMTASIFLLVWVIFWKLWRVVSSVKDTSGEVRPSENL